MRRLWQNWGAIWEFRFPNATLLERKGRERQRGSASRRGAQKTDLCSHTLFVNRFRARSGRLSALSQVFQTSALSFLRV